ncbi:MAG: hypothetical protein VB026_02045, partial [Anaerolineaceae bacterium]|nr:hypothetical protein [Anaerolineaceae bacterium]
GQVAQFNLTTKTQVFCAFLLCYTLAVGQVAQLRRVRSIFERTDNIAVVGQVAQFNLTMKTQVFCAFLLCYPLAVGQVAQLRRVRSVFERTDNIAL